MTLTLFCLLASMACSSQPADPPARYRIQFDMREETDLTQFGKDADVTWVRTTLFARVSTIDSAGARYARLVVDSLALDVAPALRAQYPTEDVFRLRGSSVQARLIEGKVQGRPVASVGATASRFGVQAFNLLFPGVKSMNIGESWSDSTETPMTNGERGSTSTVTSWRITGVSGGNVSFQGQSTSTMNGSRDGGISFRGTTRAMTTVESPIGGPAQHVHFQSTQEMIASTPEVRELPKRVMQTINIQRLP